MQLAFVAQGWAQVGVLLGNGNGTFQSVVTYESGAEGGVGIAVADVNGDGKPDVVVANENGNSNQGSVGVLLGNGDGTFQAPVNYRSGGEANTPVAVADVNGDGRPDLIATNLCLDFTHNCPGVGGDVGVLLHATFSTAITVTTSGSPSFVGQPVTFTATVTPALGSIPNGENVTFSDGTLPIGTGMIANGVVTFATSSLAKRTRAVKAIYAGDVAFAPSSGTVNQIVIGYPTSTSLSSSLNPSIYGQSMTLTAVVNPSGADAPTGQITFKWSIYTIGSAFLNGNGVATLTKSNLDADSFPLTAEYEGDANNQGSTSAI